MAGLSHPGWHGRTVPLPLHVPARHSVHPQIIAVTVTRDTVHDTPGVNLCGRGSGRPPTARPRRTGDIKTLPVLRNPASATVPHSHCPLPHRLQKGDSRAAAGFEALRNASGGNGSRATRQERLWHPPTWCVASSESPEIST